MGQGVVGVGERVVGVGRRVVGVGRRVVGVGTGTLCVRWEQTLSTVYLLSVSTCAPGTWQ